ncbi:MAG: response regulator transcription factor [Ferruginibacter sp.]
MKKIKLAIADDHKLFRDGIAGLINGFSEYEVIIEADNGKDLQQQLKIKGIPDILLLDINMKEMDGFETAEWLKENHPEIKILVLSMYENENAVIRMIKAGAKGYILKDIRKKELEQALSALILKGYYYTDMVTGKLIHNISKGPEDMSSGSKAAGNLSAREIDFLKLTCSEMTYKEIAEKMCLSVHTIDGYRDSLFEKLEVKSRVGLVMYAIKNKIVQVES